MKDYCGCSVVTTLGKHYKLLVMNYIRPIIQSRVMGFSFGLVCVQLNSAFITNKSLQI